MDFAEYIKKYVEESHAEERDIRNELHELKFLINTKLSIKNFVNLDQRVEMIEKNLLTIEKDLAWVALKLINLKASDPTSASSDHNPNPQCRDLDENHSPLSPSCEKHQRHGTYNREKVYRHTHEISHCIACGSSQDTSDHVHISFHRTSSAREAYVQLLSQILSSVLAQHGSSTLSDELFQVVSSLLLAPELKCRVELHEGHIRIQFLDDSHQEPVHSELNLRQSFHSN